MINHKNAKIRSQLVIVNGPDSPFANDNEEFIVSSDINLDSVINVTDIVLVVNLIFAQPL